MIGLIAASALAGGGGHTEVDGNAQSVAADDVEHGLVLPGARSLGPVLALGGGAHRHRLGAQCGIALVEVLGIAAGLGVADHEGGRDGQAHGQMGGAQPRSLIAGIPSCPTALGPP